MEWDVLLNGVLSLTHALQMCVLKIGSPTSWTSADVVVVILVSSPSAPQLNLINSKLMVFISEWATTTH